MHYYSNCSKKTAIAAITCICAFMSGCLFAETGKLEPDYKNVKYGLHKSQTLNFWKYKSDQPVGVLVDIHGGGWVKGGKREVIPDAFLKRGYSFCSIDYPLASKDGDKLPLMVHSAARAIQFIRYKAKEWNIDSKRIMVQGSSAGGASSLWLAYHDDLAEPDSKDPVARQSSRVAAAYAMSAQSTLDAPLIEKRIGPNVLKHQMIWVPTGAKSSEDVIDNWTEYKKLSLECSPLTHVSKDDPPVYLRYSGDASVPAKNAGHGIHHPMFGVILKEKCDKIGVPCYLNFKGNPGNPALSPRDFIAQVLTPAKP